MKRDIKGAAVDRGEGSVPTPEQMSGTATRKVVGSNPAPATKKENSHLYGGCFRFLFRVRFKFTPEGYEPSGE